MKIRYKQNGGALEEVARVYSEQEHHIDFNRIDKDAIAIIEKLNDNGFESYIVGGAVRDLLLGLHPKDFDVVTSASPRQIHKLFRNSRIIGRRFKLVHVVFGNKIIEVSTFRSTKEHEAKSDNVYGTIEEDATRRDFSINSLYYNPLDRTLLDFNNSLDDFRLRRITSLIPLNKTFIEDPVRIIRALKFSVMTGFRLTLPLKIAIRKYSNQMLKVSNSRLTEELNKIISGGFSCEIIRILHKYNILVYLLPCVSVFAKDKKLFESLALLDKKVNAAKCGKCSEVPRSDMYLALVSPFILISEDVVMSPYEMFKDIFRQIKVMLSPNTPSNAEIEETCYKFMKSKGLKIPKPSKKKSTATS